MVHTSLNYLIIQISKKRTISRKHQHLAIVINPLPDKLFQPPNLMQVLLQLSSECSWLKPHPLINELAIVTALSWQPLTQTGRKSFPARNGCHTRWEDCFLTLFVHRRTDEAHSGCFHSWAQRRPCCLYPLGAPTHHPLSHPFRPRRIYLQITLQEVTSKDEIFMPDISGYIWERVKDTRRKPSF